MLESISWQDFILCLLGGCAAYYIILLIIGKITLKRKTGEVGISPFSGQEPRKRKWVPEEPEEDEDVQSTIINNEEQHQEEPAQEDNTFTALESLADEVQNIIILSGVSNTTKEELFSQLRKEIARYPTLNKPALQRAISNLIIKSARQECAMDVSKEEADALWPGQ